jgi:hypothetical protein
VSKSNDLDLMLLADGESAPTSGAELARAPSARERAKIEGIQEVGSLVRGHLELAADDAEDRLAGLWDLVERRLDAEARAEEPVKAPAQARREGTWARFLGWLGGHRSQLLTGVVAAGAAAAITVVARPTGTNTRTVYLPPGPDVAVGGSGAGSNGVQMVRATPTEVESLEVSGGTGAVFTIDDEDGETTVIWVTPDDVVEGI